MAPAPTRVHEPVESHRREYDRLYLEYKRLYDYFGRGSNEVMALLRGMRRPRAAGTA
jgi:L-ribulokinase